MSDFAAHCPASYRFNGILPQYIAFFSRREVKNSKVAGPEAARCAACFSDRGIVLPNVRTTTQTLRESTGACDNLAVRSGVGAIIVARNWG